MKASESLSAETAKMIRDLERVLRQLYRQQESLFDDRPPDEKGLENLIGTIPFLLMNQRYFERNQEIAMFAESLGIHIPSPEKKKREDMIGRIVSAIASFDNRMINQLNDAISRVKRSGFQGKSSFFIEWDNAIRKMKL